MTQTTRSLPWLLAVALLAGRAQAQDGVAAMCAELASPDACACASEALLSEIGPQDFDLYDTIGGDYVERMARGESRVDAWNAASATAAAEAGIAPRALMSRTNEIGAAHRAAIDTCTGS